MAATTVVPFGTNVPSENVKSFNALRGRPASGLGLNRQSG